MRVLGFLLYLLLVLLALLVNVIARKGKNQGKGSDSKNIKSSNNLLSSTSSSPISSRHRKTTKKRRKLPSSSVHAIVPTRKEPIALRALKGMAILKKSLLSNAEAALITSSKVQRQLKTYFSSDYEQLLLRMTAPTNMKPDDDDVERFVATIETFVRNMDVTSQSNPYRVTLRKLWTKAAEPDGRTVLKAQYLLHILLRNTSPEDAIIFKTLLNKMMRETCKKPGNCKYFDMNKLTSVSADTMELQDFIERYSTYVFQRAKTFTSSFEEMKLIEYGMRTEDICAQLMKAYKVLDTAFTCCHHHHRHHDLPHHQRDGTGASGGIELSEQYDIVLACLELVAADVRDLFRLFHVKLLWVLREEQRGDLFAGWESAEVKAVLTHFKTFYNDRYEDFESLLNTVAKLVKRQFGTTMNVALDPAAVFEDDIPSFPRRKQRSTSSAPSSSSSSSTSSPSSSSSSPSLHRVSPGEGTTGGSRSSSSNDLLIDELARRSNVALGRTPFGSQSDLGMVTELDDEMIVTDPGPGLGPGQEQRTTSHQHAPSQSQSLTKSNKITRSSSPSSTKDNNVDSKKKT